MPGRNRKGPAGAGPMTGRGFGSCGTGMGGHNEFRSAGRSGRCRGYNNRGMEFGGRDGQKGQGRCFHGGNASLHNVADCSCEVAGKDLLDREIAFRKTVLKSLKKQRRALEGRN